MTSTRAQRGLKRFFTCTVKRLKWYKTDMVLILVVPVTSRMTLGGQPQPPFVVI